MAKHLIEFFDRARNERWCLREPCDCFWRDFRQGLLEAAIGIRVQADYRPSIDALEEEHQLGVAEFLTPMNSEEFLKSRHGPDYRFWLEKTLYWYRFKPAFMERLAEAWIQYPVENARFFNSALYVGFRESYVSASTFRGAFDIGLRVFEETNDHCLLETLSWFPRDDSTERRLWEAGCFRPFWSAFIAAYREELGKRFRPAPLNWLVSDPQSHRLVRYVFVVRGSSALIGLTEGSQKFQRLEDEIWALCTDRIGDTIVEESLKSPAHETPHFRNYWIVEPKKWIRVDNGFEDPWEETHENLFNTYASLRTIVEHRKAPTAPVEVQQI